MWNIHISTYFLLVPQVNASFYPLSLKHPQPPAHLTGVAYQIAIPLRNLEAQQSVKGMYVKNKYIPNIATGGG